MKSRAPLAILCLLALGGSHAHAEEAPAPAPAPAPRTYDSFPAIIATTVTGVFVLTGITFYARSRTLTNQAEDATDRDEHDRLLDDAKPWKYGSWAMFGLAGITAVTSVYLWWQSTQPIAVAPTPGGAQVSFSMRF